MSNLKGGFKSIADDLMKGIKVTEELKDKTLMKATKKRHVSIRKFLVPVASLVLIFGMVNISGNLLPKTETGTDKNQEINLLIGSENEEVPSGEQADNNTVPDVGAVTTWTLATTKDAKENFGASFLTPLYIPENFNLHKIQASGVDKNHANKVIITYLAGEQSFLIIEEKIETQNKSLNFKSIDINGTKGYIKSSASNEENPSSLDTELHWFKDEIHYSIIGLITEEEAIKVAKSMK